MILHNLFQTPGVSSVRVHLDDGPAGTHTKELCFPFVTDQSSGGHTGCCGSMWNKRGKVVHCDRQHVDLSSSEYSSTGKQCLQEIWDFVQHPAVQECYKPTAAFVDFMNE
jgi:hypothetical protein